MHNISITTCFKKVRELEKEFIIRNRLGLHLRAAAQFVKIASRYDADIHVAKENTSVNGKSIMGLAMLAAGKGTKIIIRAVGRDASQAIDALTALIENKFGED